MSDGRPQFDFGANWKAFSEHALTAAAVEEAKKDFIQLLGGIDLAGQSFLDIGFGQGLTLLTATLMGANTVGCDINAICAEILQANQRRYFPELSDRTIPIIVGSILDEAMVESLRSKSPDPTTRAYNIVHSWGVLHHTGEMERAIRSAASLVAPHGFLIIAIYARHWSSAAWRILKRVYNKSPPAIQRLLVGILYPVIYLAKWCVTARSPLKQTRGMNFYYDLVDWIGGYPYEYATVEDVNAILSALGFRLERIIPRTVPTGCNQFVFRLLRLPAVTDLTSNKLHKGQ
jgi:SAM-dependent methyltransferase